MANLRFTPERVRVMRKALGSTQAEFARRLGVSTRVVSMWETGTRRPETIETLEALLDLDDYLIRQDSERF